MNNREVKNITANPSFNYVAPWINFFVPAIGENQEYQKPALEQSLEEKTRELEALNKDIKLGQKTMLALMEKRDELLQFLKDMQVLKLFPGLPLKDQIILFQSGKKPSLVQQILKYGFGETPQDKLQDTNKDKISQDISSKIILLQSVGNEIFELEKQNKQVLQKRYLLLNEMKELHLRLSPPEKLLLRLSQPK